MSCTRLRRGALGVIWSGGWTPFLPAPLTLLAAFMALGNDGWPISAAAAIGCLAIGSMSWQAKVCEGLLCIRVFGITTTVIDLPESGDICIRHRAAPKGEKDMPQLAIAQPVYLRKGLFWPAYLVLARYDLPDYHVMRQGIFFERGPRMNAWMRALEDGRHAQPA